MTDYISDLISLRDPSAKVTDVITDVICAVYN